jgi:hypothetical protein
MNWISFVQRNKSECLMRIPFMAVVLVILAGALPSQAQSATSPTQLVHPVLKDPNKRLAPTSLDRDPSLLGDPAPAANPAPARSAAAPAAAQPANPAVIVAKIDAGLVASKLSLMGTMNGLRGTIYVTNLGSQELTPVVQVAVCDQKGFKLGAASKTGVPLAPNADERIVLLGTNLNAADLKLMRLTSVGAK